jgi:hypothetical protein
MPKCPGLACPPWPVPDDLSVCFEADGKYFSGVYRPWGWPWNQNRNTLLALQGQKVSIVPTEKEIRIAIPGHKLRLKRVHNNPIFDMADCIHD